MTELNEEAKEALREAVLQRRIDLRLLRDRAEVAQAEFKASVVALVKCAHGIADLQEAVGDPREMDPSFPGTETVIATMLAAVAAMTATSQEGSSHA